MSKQVSPTFRISMGLVGLTLSLLMATHLLGLLPDERLMQVEARGRIAESLAMQLSGAISRTDVVTLDETMQSVVIRNKDILSMALRKADGDIVVAAGEHDTHWQTPHEDRSTPTHIQIPLSNGESMWGKIEMAFAPLPAAAGIAGIPYKMWGLMLFLGGWGFFGYYFVLRRALRELDPGKAIPERVQSAFNTLAEGVLILDEQGYILLANDAFSSAIGRDADGLFGADVTRLQWRRWGEANQSKSHPWMVALREGCNVTGAKLGYKTRDGQFKNFVVNATRILDKTSDRATGVIVTFDDVTALECKNDDLIKAVRKLQKSEEEISEQNRELQYLANHDPLTGCLNRRAFFERFADKLEQAQENGQPLTCLMADLDHFKRVNDTYGHGVGDDVIAGMAKVLNQVADEQDLVGRYGGEEFCVALVGKDAEQSRALAEQIRTMVAELSPVWFDHKDKITSSLGLACRPEETSSVKQIVDWADQALYKAKETGRNKVVEWDPVAMVSLQLDDDQAEAAAPDEAQAQMHMVPTTKASLEAPSLFADNAASATAHHAVDPMTKLPSPIIFNDRLSQSLLRAEADGKIVAVMQIAIESIDRFASALGEATARDLIATISTRFASTLNRGDVLSLHDGMTHPPSLTHVGNGQFLVEVADLEETNTVVWFVQRLLESLKAPVTIGDNLIYASANIGISLYPGDANDGDTLLRHASTALQFAQEAGEDKSYQFYAEEMNVHSRRQLTIETGIRQALDHDQFYLSYQPIIDAKTGQLRGLETLLRSDHPDFTGMPIGSLIEVAERAGLIIEIGEWVLKTAVRQAEQWIEQGRDIPRISVNLSAVQLNSQRAMERLMQVILTMDLSPRRLQFEITETAILRDVDIAGQALMNLQQLGVMIALDDFGTGQSSLGYLRRFRPDVLKIDRCFIGDITSSQADESLVSAIVLMSQRMNIRVVAEGVETRAQLEKVRDIGCDDIQGFYFAKPMPADRLDQWLQAHHGKRIRGGAHTIADASVA